MADETGGRKTGLTRLLRYGSAGEDVLAVKRRLFELGCYSPHITQLKTNAFGADTRAAVRVFQAQNGLETDGVVGPLTYGALFPEAEADAPPLERTAISPNIGDAAAALILPALERAGAVRRGIVFDALQFAFDAEVARDYPVSLYIRGGNLYNTDLTPNVITLARISSGAKRQPEYYDGGRREMMERAVLENPDITGADCSGGVVGLLRHAGVVAAGFDLSADGFHAKADIRHIPSAELAPGDLLHKSGHVGLYAGGGYAAEWMGGAYGCQLTKLAARRGWNFVKQKTDRFGAWTGYLHPTWY
ncbi:MAG: peptidoglycan-binding protein [Clostridiales bacterium]|nr:peptidoglycan-binding protein [Clostridiales bacterium]